MLSKLDGLYPPFSPDVEGEGFSYESVNATARNWIWPGVSVPIVITEMRMGELTMINVTGAISKLDFTNKKGKAGAILIDYEFPYSFIGMSGKSLTVCVPTSYNWNNTKQGGSAQIRFDGDTRKMSIWSNEQESYENGNNAGKFKLDENALEGAMCGIQSFTLWANTTVTPSLTGGASLGEHVSQKASNPEVVEHTYTISYFTDEGTEIEYEVPCFLNDDGTLIPKYLLPTNWIYNLPDDCSQKYKLKYTGDAAKLIKRYMYYDDPGSEDTYIWVNLDDTTDFLYINKEEKKIYGLKSIFYNSSIFIIRLSEDEDYTDMTKWIVVYKGKCYTPELITVDGNTIALKIGDISIPAQKITTYL